MKELPTEKKCMWLMDLMVVDVCADLRFIDPLPRLGVESQIYPSSIKSVPLQFRINLFLLLEAILGKR